MLVSDAITLDTDQLFGDGLATLAAVNYAAYLISVAKLRNKLATLPLLLGATVVASVILFVIALLEGVQLFPETADGWAILIAMALVSQAFGQGLIGWALAHVSTALSSLALLIQPVIAGILAWVLFQEDLSYLEITGGVVVLIGIFLAKQDKSSASVKPIKPVLQPRGYTPPA